MSIYALSLRNQHNKDLKSFIDHGLKELVLHLTENLSEDQTKGFTLEEIKKIASRYPDLNITVHILSYNYKIFAQELLATGINKIVFQLEYILDNSLQKLIKYIENKEIKTGFAVFTNVNLRRFNDYIRGTRDLTILSNRDLVDLDLLSRLLKYLKQMNHEMTITLDAAFLLKELNTLKEFGINNFVLGGQLNYLNFNQIKDILNNKLD